jgi:putative Holliday junction resolvase
MKIPTQGRVMALDWGEVRIGVALCDELQMLASPLCTVSRRAGKRFPMPALLALVAQHGPVGLIVGLPLTPDGEEQDAARGARDLGTLMADRTALPVEYLDERFTTARAHREIRAQGGSTRGRKDDVDSLAAAVLLQGWLDGRRSDVRTFGLSDE